MSLVEYMLSDQGELSLFSTVCRVYCRSMAAVFGIMLVFTL